MVDQVIRAQFDWSNTPGNVPSRPLMPGGAAIQEADGKLFTRHADGSTRATDLRPLEEQMPPVLPGTGVDLGAPAILTLAQEILARGVVPAGRIGVTGGSNDTVKWQAACADALLTYPRPVELNAGVAHRIASKIKFPARSGILNPGGASIAADCADFNNTSGSLTDRYGDNAVVLGGVQGAANLRFEGLRIVLSAASAAVFKERRVQGLALIGCDDAKIIDVEMSGFNAGALINLQSCRRFLALRPYLHDCLSHTASMQAVTAQLTAFLVDGDELIDGSGARIGSTGRIEYPRIVDMRVTDEVFANVTDQTDGINVAGNFADVTIIEPYIENVAEALDIFGRVTMRGGRFLNLRNFAIKLVHGAQGCDIQGWQARNIGIAGVVLTSLANEPRGVVRNTVRGALDSIGTLSMGALTVNGQTASAVTSAPVGPGDTFEVLALDQGATYPISENLIEVEIRRCTKSTNPIRLTASGTGNIVRFTSPDGSTDTKANLGSAGNSIRRIEKSTLVKAYAASAQAFTTATAVLVCGTEVSDSFNEWDGSTFNPKFSGTYRVSAYVRFEGTSASDQITLSVRQNGVAKNVAFSGYTGVFPNGQLGVKIQYELIMAVGDNADVTLLLNAAQSSTPGELYTGISISRLTD